MKLIDDYRGRIYLGWRDDMVAGGCQWRTIDLGIEDDGSQVVADVGLALH